MKQLPWTMVSTPLVLMIIGCNSSDDRLAGLAERSTAGQARQNRTTSEMTRATAENQRRLVETVEKSRQDLVALRKNADKQRAATDQERRDLANERHRESLLAPMASGQA